MDDLGGSAGTAGRATVTWPPGTPQYMCEVLKHFETEIDGEGGWDRAVPMGVYAILGPGEHANGWSREALLTEPGAFALFGRNTREAFLNFAVYFIGRAGGLVSAEILAEIAERGLHVLVLVSEAWSVAAITQEERAKVFGLADHPDAQETRTVIAVAPDSTVYQVARVRGRTDPVHDGHWFNDVTKSGGEFAGGDYRPGTTIASMGGLLVNTMRVMVNAVNARTGTPALDITPASDDEKSLIEQVLGRPL